MEFKLHKLTTKWGEEIEIRETPSGETICPVCGGSFGGDWPWGEYYECDAQGDPFGEPYAAPSFDGCPCCLTQYGFDDYPRDGRTLKEEWEELRKEWMAKVGLAANVKGQLANLGIVLE